MHVCVKMMSKGSKQALTVLIVTHATQVKRVKSGVCGFYAHCIQSYSIYYSCRKGRKCTLYTVAPRPCQEGRLLCEPSVLGV